MDALAGREIFNKHLFRPNTYLHKWWARRCGTTFRAILKQFVAEGELRDFYAPGGLKGKIVLDPMMGGGTTLHEALRMGAGVIGADIDPVPIVLARASLSERDMGRLRACFAQMMETLEGGLAHRFQTQCPDCGVEAPMQYGLHALRKRCRCSPVLQVDQYLLRQEAGRSSYLAADGSNIVHAPPQHTLGASIISKGADACPGCGQEYRERVDLPFYQRYSLVALFAHCAEHGPFWRTPGEADRTAIREADAVRASLDFGDPNEFAIQKGPKSRQLISRGVASFLDLFSSRQLLVLHGAIEALRGLDAPERLNMGLLISASLEFNSLLCGYKGWQQRRSGAIRHAFSLHAYAPHCTALENNPLHPKRASGNLRMLFQSRWERGDKWAMRPVERRIEADGSASLVPMDGERDAGVEVSNASELLDGPRRFMLLQGHSGRLPMPSRSVDLVVTDPPYHDSVQYGDLSAFFRVWLAKLLPDEAQWRYDEAGCASAAGRWDEGRSQEALRDVFKECRRVLKTPAGQMAFTYHHWDPKAWAVLTMALKEAGFQLADAHVVRSEHPISVHVHQLKSLRHDCLLRLQPIDQDPARDWPPVESVDARDSETFCRRCAAALGWMLSGDAPDGLDIPSAWRRLAKGLGDRSRAIS